MKAYLSVLSLLGKLGNVTIIAIHRGGPYIVGLSHFGLPRARRLDSINLEFDLSLIQIKVWGRRINKSFLSIRCHPLLDQWRVSVFEDVLLLRQLATALD